MFNISVLANIPSIMERGIICHDYAAKVQHQSVAMESVQSRRAGVVVPNGMRLHAYANLYFDYHNPMLYKIQNQADLICILAISASVLDLPDCIVTDRNAAALYAMFYPAPVGIGCLDFKKIFARDWNHPDQIEYREHKHIKCAEVLLPRLVPSEYIEGAYVVDETAKKQMISAGFSKKIVPNASVFYRKNG